MPGIPLPSDAQPNTRFCPSRLHIPDRVANRAPTDQNPPQPSNAPQSSPPNQTGNETTTQQPAKPPPSTWYPLPLFLVGDLVEQPKTLKNLLGLPPYTIPILHKAQTTTCRLLIHNQVPLLSFRRPQLNEYEEEVIPVQGWIYQNASEEDEKKIMAYVTEQAQDLIKEHEEWWAGWIKSVGCIRTVASLVDNTRRMPARPGLRPGQILVRTFVVY